MKLHLVLIACMVLVASTVFAQDKVELKTQKDKQSYAIGANMGKGLKKSAVDVDPEILTRAIKDTLVNGKSQRGVVSIARLETTISSSSVAVRARWCNRCSV